MRIRRPRSLTGTQIGIATVIGVLSGYYIWRPVFTSERVQVTTKISAKDSLAAKYAGKPVLLLVAAVGFTFSFYGFYGILYKPYEKRKRYMEAQKYADYIFQQEIGKTDS